MRMADTDAKTYTSAHLYSVFEQFLCYFFATCDSDEHILQYGCTSYSSLALDYHAHYQVFVCVYVCTILWLVTAACLFLNIACL